MSSAPPATAAPPSPLPFPLGGVWHHVPICDSTSDELLRLGRAGAVEGTVYTADAQRQGRGRQGRIWHSPPGDHLYLSILLRPPLPPHRAPPLCLVAGLALYDAVRDVLIADGLADRVALRLKWPNDLLAAPTLDGQPPPLASPAWRKLGGILTELVGTANAIDFVVVGVGCNVLGDRFPADVPATSLRILTRRALPVDPGPDGNSIPADQPLRTTPHTLSLALLSTLTGWYARYLQQGPDAVLSAFTLAAGLGPAHPPVHVRVAPHDPPLIGVPEGLGPAGELILRTPTGLTRVVSGELALSR